MDIYQTMISNCFLSRETSKLCKQSILICRRERIFEFALHYSLLMESMVLSWWEFEERENDSKDEYDYNWNFVLKLHYYPRYKGNNGQTHRFKAFLKVLPSLNIYYDLGVNRKW